MDRRWRICGNLLLWLVSSALALACAGGAGTVVEPPSAPRTLASLPPLDSTGDEVVLEPLDPEATYLAPNAKDTDGTAAYVHYVREDMPLRINVELPRQSARYASRDETRAAVLDGMRMWGEAIQSVYPWFAMEFVEGDPAAHVQIDWRRRIPGDIAGKAGIGWSVENGTLRLSSRLDYTTQTCLAISCQLTADELRLLVAHEFGHALGLMHCLDCDSAMNYAWNTLERVVVTEIDVLTYRALSEKTSGQRVDGQLLTPLR